VYLPQHTYKFGSRGEEPTASFEKSKDSLMPIEKAGFHEGQGTVKGNKSFAIFSSPSLTL